MMKRIHITTGDTDGIGLEISLKALSTIRPQKNIQFILWRKPQARKHFLKNFKWSGERITLNKVQQLDKNTNLGTLIHMAPHLSPTKWVEIAARRCMQNPLKEALVTGPLSKTGMRKDAYSEIGHTPLLQKIAKVKNVFMTFLGDYFNVTLLTGHIPLKKIKWQVHELHSCLNLCTKLKKYLPKNKQNKPIAILGLNPHAGEEGCIGTEEKLLRRNLIKWKAKVHGPLVPDSAFLKSNWEKFSIYISLYHDQALIPFKMIHETKSFALSLGLPFIRTSVSHGTAKDIFGKNKASAESMKRALKWTMHALKQSG